MIAQDKYLIGVDKMTANGTFNASQRLYDEVITTGLCTMCGGCVGLCPYFRINPIRGNVKRIDICDRAEGRCYQHCPRASGNKFVPLYLPYC